MSEAGKQKKILMVEDDADTAESLRVVLEGEGYQVSHASSAPAGLAAARAGRPDLILLDVMMPSGTEGFHFVWDLRRDADEAVKKTPIIVLTAIHQTTKLRFYPDESEEAGEYLPVQGFLDKPVDSARLLEEVGRALGGAR